MKGQRTTYAQAGVNISAGNHFAQLVRERIAAVWPRSAKEIGGFAGGMPIPKGKKKFKGCCDGAGTKPILAALADRFECVGQDAAAMSLVDAYVAGALPAALLDTISIGHLVPEIHIRIIDGIIAGCRLAGATLIGGETAELPGVFKYDWMFLVDTTAIAFPAPKLKYVPVRAGQPVFGWMSHGPAANGLSLIRRVFGLNCGPALARKRLECRLPELGGKSLAEVVLQPTPIYIKQVEAQRQKGVVFSGHAHITGGGPVENIPRILPPDLKVRIDRAMWNRPAIFPLIQRLGDVPGEDMDRTFNQGIMMISIISDRGTDRPFEPLEVGTSKVKHIGEVVKRNGDEPQVELVGKYVDEY